MDLLSPLKCNSSRWYNGRIRSTNLCAGYPEGKVDTCQVTPLCKPELLSWFLPGPRQVNPLAAPMENQPP